MNVPGPRYGDRVPNKDVGATGMVGQLLMFSFLPGHLLLAPVLSEWEVAGFIAPARAAYGPDSGRRLCSAGHHSVLSAHLPSEQVSPTFSSRPL